MTDENTSDDADEQNSTDELIDGIIAGPDPLRDHERPDSYDPEHRDRVLVEILDSVDVYDASLEGPEGPWLYKSLAVTRVLNTITVYDVDGQCCDVLHVPDMSDLDDPHGALERKLETLNSETMAEL